MKGAPDPPDSRLTKLALLPARIRYWREQGAEEMAKKLEIELEAEGLAERPPSEASTSK